MMKKRTGVDNFRHRIWPVWPSVLAAVPVLAAFPVLTLLSVFTVGCRPQAVGTDEVVSVDGDEIRYSEFESYVRENVDSTDLPLGPQVLEKLFDQFLDEKLLMRLAMDHGMGQENPVEQREAVAYLLRQTPPRPPGEIEIAAHYDAHREEYLRPESVRLNQILVHERTAADKALAALNRGEDFHQVAARFSQVPLVVLGDSRGRLTREDLPEAFADSIFELEPGKVSEIFAADYGFHIFQVVEKFPAADLSLGAAAEGIRRILERQRRDDQVTSFIEQARGRYNVRIHPSNFPFDYRGSYAQ